jgi:hypothetical protein
MLLKLHHPNHQQQQQKQLRLYVLTALQPSSLLLTRSTAFRVEHSLAARQFHWLIPPR